MRVLPFASLLVFSRLVVACGDRSLKTVKEEFEKANLPTLLNLTFHPKCFLDVIFPGVPGSARPTSITLHAGVQLPRNQTINNLPDPMFGIRGHREECNNGKGPFVIAEVDPDAPSAADPYNGPFRHFLGSNFFVTGKKSDEGAHLLTNKTEELTTYKEPRPAPGTGLHRYAFFIFNQPTGFERQKYVTFDTPMEKFNVSQFAKETGLGYPIGGSFMYVAPDAPA